MTQCNLLPEHAKRTNYQQNPGIRVAQGPKVQQNPLLEPAAAHLNSLLPTTEFPLAVLLGDLRIEDLDAGGVDVWEWCLLVTFSLQRRLGYY